MIVREKMKLSEDAPMIKIVVDLERKVLSYGCELHIDCADELVSDGSAGSNLWGANVYPKDKKIAFISLINIRPADGNRSMEIQLPEIREKMSRIITDLLL